MEAHLTALADSFTPATAEELAATLGDASEASQPVVPWGAGTHQHLGAPPLAGALRLYTNALNRITEYAPADLTATVEAGVTLGSLQATLAPEGQWLPWNPPGGERATIGGLVAAGLSGPLRLGYGTARDRVLGMTVALGDGRLVKSGGRVVKNVAGYDAHKLHIGAFGTLGVIVSATFKLAPLPERRASIAFLCPSVAVALTLAARLRERPLSPISLAMHQQPVSVMLYARFAGVDAAVERQLRVATAHAAALAIAPVSADDEGLWRDLARWPIPGSNAMDLVLRAGVRPSAMSALTDALARHAPSPAATLAFPGVGLAYARWPGHDPAVVLPLAALRADLLPHAGYVVVEYAPSPLHATLDIWGPPPATLALMRGLKQQWDPAGILNPGRYLEL
jgi:glycolate oxidase FAD binding subunit